MPSRHLLSRSNQLSLMVSQQFYLTRSTFFLIGRLTSQNAGKTIHWDLPEEMHLECKHGYYRWSVALRGATKRWQWTIFTMRVCSSKQCPTRAHSQRCNALCLEKPHNRTAIPSSSPSRPPFCVRTTNFQGTCFLDEFSNESLRTRTFESVGRKKEKNPSPEIWVRWERFSVLFAPREFVMTFTIFFLFYTNYYAWWRMKLVALRWDRRTDAFSSATQKEARGGKPVTKLNTHP